jgi:hypothetical protein
MHKTRIRLYLCFKKPIRKNKIRFTYTTRTGLHQFVSTTIGLNLEIISAGMHCNVTHTGLEALMCTGRIAEMTTSCYMLLMGATTNVIGQS